jgi:hypothetical protein
VLVRDELRARGRAARIETAWVRPGWPLVYAALALVGVLGSLVCIGAPAIGLGLVLAALVLLAGDVTGLLPVARLVLPRRATACVVSEPPATARQARVRLIVTASLDSGRSAVAGRLAPLEAAARRVLRGHLASPPALLVAALVILAALAGARVAGADGSWLGVVALIPTVALVVAVAAYLDLAGARPSTGANAHASAAAVALALVDELDRRPPRHLAVELVLAGGGEAGQLGLAAYIRARRRGARPEELAVLALGPCGAGRPRFHVSEGSLPARRLHPGLVAAARATTESDPGLGAAPARRQVSGALAARRAGWPALGISALDERGLPGAARTPGDEPEHLQAGALAATLGLCRGVVARVDKRLG